MRYTLLMLVLVVSPVVAQNKPVIPDRVGRIIIEGNANTPDSVILRKLKLRPGNIMDYAPIEASRKRLAKMVIFDDSNPSNIEVVQSKFGGPIKDVRVRVKERPESWFVLRARQIEIERAKHPRGKPTPVPVR